MHGELLINIGVEYIRVIREYINYCGGYNNMPEHTKKKLDRMCDEAGGVWADELKHWLQTRVWEGNCSDNMKQMVVQKFTELCDRMVEGKA